MRRVIFVEQCGYDRDFQDTIDKALKDLPKETKITGINLAAAPVPISDPGSGPKHKVVYSALIAVECP